MLSIGQAYDRFNSGLVPTERERGAAAGHRQSVESALRSGLQVAQVRETGSFSHGTGVRGRSDVDVLVSLTSAQPGSSDTILTQVRAALKSRFPYTEVKVRRPAVVVEFASKTEQWEVIPAYYKRTSGSGYSVYDIPGSASGWIETGPKAHLDYVTEINDRQVTYRGAKRLARMLKAWKYYRSVPVSSFYLEMRAAEHVATQSSFIPIWDMSQVLTKPNNHGLASMNDPKGVAGRINPCSSAVTKLDAQSKLDTAATRAANALQAHQNGNEDLAFYYTDQLYAANFPSRWST